MLAVFNVYLNADGYAVNFTLKKKNQKIKISVDIYFVHPFYQIVNYHLLRKEEIRVF